jgi:host factor-I protein
MPSAAMVAQSPVSTRRAAALQHFHIEMTDQSQLLQNEFLNTLRKERVLVSLFLVNGIRLAGHIQSFDQYSIRLHGPTPQLVLKRVVATVVPEKPGRARSAPDAPVRAPRRRAPPTA